MIPIFRQEVDSMKNSTILAVMMCLLGCVPVRLTARGIQPNPAVADLRTALDLDRRGGYREALARISHQLFSTGAEGVVKGDCDLALTWQFQKIACG
jgi:hypothetical protein